MHYGFEKLLDCLSRNRNRRTIDTESLMEVDDMMMVNDDVGVVMINTLVLCVAGLVEIIHLKETEKQKNKELHYKFYCCPEREKW